MNIFKVLAVGATVLVLSLGLVTLLRSDGVLSRLFNIDRSTQLSQVSGSEDGSGLRGTYFSETGKPVFSRVDPTVNFDWGEDSPSSSLLGTDNFAVIWEGEIRPEHSETYTFHVTADDGVRLYVNDRLIVDEWHRHSSTTFSGSINLNAEQKYDIRLEYFEATRNADVSLEWQSSSQNNEVIPKSNLFPASTSESNPPAGFLDTESSSSSSTTTEILTPIEDAYLQNGNRFNNNLLRVESENRTRVAYLKFDASHIDGSVTDAMLSLTVQNDDGNGTFYVHSGNSDNWTEDNLSSSNAPEPTEELATRTGSFELGTTHNFDVSGLTGDIYTIILSMDGNDDFAFGSSESNALPRLELTVEGTDTATTETSTEEDDDSDDTTNDDSSTKTDTIDDTSTENETASDDTSTDEDPKSDGDGLRAEFFNWEGGRLHSRVDPAVNFNWENSSPDSSVPTEYFTAVWQGEIRPEHSETYTFHVTADDGVRLYVNDRLIVDEWHRHSSTTFSGSISLNAEQKYDIRLEYFEATGYADVSLEWQSSSQSREIVPQANLYAAQSVDGDPGEDVAPEEDSGTGDSSTETETTESITTGDGLRTIFFDWDSNQLHSRVDSSVNFDWRRGSPHSNVPNNYFTAVWQGEIRPEHSETYTFHVTADDGVRLYVNDRLIVDEWHRHSSTTFSGSISLNAEQKYDIRLEYFEATGYADVSLEWQSSSQSREIVPQANLYAAESVDGDPGEGVEDSDTSDTDTDDGGDNNTDEYPMGEVTRDGYGPIDNPTVPNNAVYLNPGDNIQQAINNNPNGTAFVFRSGVYRGASFSPKDGNTFIGEKGAILSGARVLSNFSREGDLYVANDQRHRGEHGPGLSGKYDVCQSKAPRCDHSEDLYIDNEPLMHVDSKSKVRSGTWYFDYDNDKIYFADDPSGKTVEASVTERAIDSSADNVTVRNLVIEKYGNPEQTGAVGERSNTRNWVIADNLIRLNHGGGLRMSNSMTVRGNSFYKNGNIGMSGAAGNGTLVENNEIAYNNYAFYSAGFVAGGTKFVHASNLTLRNNYVHHNGGPGLWADADNRYVLYENNIVTDNEGHGIFHEISYDAVIRNNVTDRNGFGDRYQSWVNGGGITISNSPNVEIYNNTVRDNRMGITAKETNRSGYGSVENLDVHDNFIRMPSGRTGIAVSGQINNEDPYYNSMNNRFYDNDYELGDLSGSHFQWTSRMNASEWRQAGNDTNGSFNTID